MSLDQKIKSLEERIADLEAQNEEFRQLLGLPGTDKAALEAAIIAIVDSQDVSMLDSYLKRGGKIPVNGGNHV